LSTGNAAAEGLKTIAEGVAPGWTAQFGLWRDSGNPAERYVVMRPIGGPGGGRLVRQPLISVMFVGATGDAAAVPSQVAEAFTAALRLGPVNGVAYAEATEPTLTPTSDGRPVAEVVVSSIVSL
jgi:hypothetical protein